MDVKMELICSLSVVNRQGGVIQNFSRGSITVTSMNENSTPSEEPFLFICTRSNAKFRAKYNLIGNIEHLSIRFLDEGQAIVCLKEPSYNIFITKADPDKLTAFIVSLKKLLPADSPVRVSMAAFEQPIRRIYFDCQRKYMLKMKSIIRMNTNLDQCTELEISDCTLELAGDQVPIADAIKKMKNLTTLQLENIKLCSSTFLEIESKELKELHLCWCKTQLPIASLFKNDLCYKDSLVELNLDGNQWSYVPNGIFEFGNLLKLSLNNNCITELPDKFTNLPKLQELLLSSNQLRRVPPSIFQIQNLLKLSLHKNHITELPDLFINLSKLQVLSLSNNQLRSVPSSIFALQNLSELSLSGNLITELPDKFTNLPKLQYLSISNNQIHYLPPSIYSLYLQRIDIGFNEFNLEIPPALGSEVIVHSLKELSYRTILKHKLKVEEGMLPKRFLKDLDNYHQCVCGCKFVNEGQNVVFSINLNNISDFIWYNNDTRHLLFPIRGKMCNSFKSCFQDRFT